MGTINVPFVDVISTSPVPSGSNTISPLVLVADIILAVILILPNVEPPVVVVVPETVRFPVTARVSAKTLTSPVPTGASTKSPFELVVDIVFPVNVIF